MVLYKNLGEMIGGALQTMEDQIILQFGMKPREKEVDMCRCRQVDGVYQCTIDKCNKRNVTGTRIACGRTGHICPNNPWRDGSFAIDNGKVHVTAAPDTGYGLFASEPIPKGAFIGEVKGRVYDLDEVPPDLEWNYAFQIPETRQVIYPGVKGSAMQFLNHR